MAPVPNPAEDATAFLQRLQAALVPATRAAGVLPGANDWRFHRALDRPLARAADAQAARVLATADRVLEWVAAASSSSSAASARSSRRHAASLRPNPLADASQVSADQFSATLGDVVDHLLQRADTFLAEHRNLCPPPPRSSASHRGPLPQFQPAGTSMRNKSMPLPPRVLRAVIDPLPQRSYVDSKPDNRLGIPWSRPLRFGRPHAREVPADWLPPCPVDANGEPLPEGRRMGTYSEEDDPRKNPYYYEILTSDPPGHAYVLPDVPEAPPENGSEPEKKDEAPPENGSEPEEKDEQPSPQPSGAQVSLAPTPLTFENAEGLAGVPFTWIDSKVGIEALLSHLSEDRVTEIAVDLEHHSLRTFQGLTCLMQISTRWHDFIVDTLTEDVRVHAEKLNQVFADPNKVKVLHGADSDVLWLQRDLGLYLVGLFDTFHACTRLEFPGRGLAYLLARYVNFEADKRFQLADWRIRPLPLEMLFYARSDTHSLLYVYDRLRVELFAQGGKDAITDVFTRSKSVEAKVYIKPEWNEDGSGPEGWTGFYKRFSAQLARTRSAEPADATEARAQDAWHMLKSMFLLRELHRWRDSVARSEDDGTRYVLAIHAMLQLIQIAPTTPPGVTGALSGKLTPLLRKYRDEIASMLEGAVKCWDEAVKKASSLHEGQWPKLAEALERVRDELRLPHNLTAGIIAGVGKEALVSPPAPAGGVPIHPMARLLSAAQQADALSRPKVEAPAAQDSASSTEAKAVEGTPSEAAMSSGTSTPNVPSEANVTSSVTPTADVPSDVPSEADKVTSSVTPMADVPSEAKTTASLEQNLGAPTSPPRESKRAKSAPKRKLDATDPSPTPNSKAEKRRRRRSKSQLAE